MDAESAEEWNEKGKKQLEKGNLDIAIMAFERAIEEANNFPAAWYNKGIAYSRRGELKQAGKCFDKAIELCSDILEKEPDNAEAWFVQGRAFYMQKEPEAAIDCFKQALKIKPKNGLLFNQAKFELGRIAYELGENKPKALSTIAEAAKGIAQEKK